MSTTASSKHAHLATPNEEWVIAVSKLPPPPKNDPSQDSAKDPKTRMLERRKATKDVLEAMREANPLVLDDSKIRMVEHKIAVDHDDRGDVEIRAAVYIPIPNTDNGETAETRFPLIVFYHGGGFALMDIEMEEERLTNLAIASRIAVLNVDYRLSPENPFPIGLTDSYNALKWAILNDKSLMQADVSKGLLVGGMSSGGNFAAAICAMARDDSSFPAHAKITGQLLQVPLLSHPAARGKFADEIFSPYELADDEFLSKEALEDTVAAYIQDPTIDVHDPRISPLLTPSLAGLPPAFIQICGMDPLRDEDLLYARLLQEVGVPTRIEIYPGVPHCFHHFVPSFSLSKKWNVDAEEGIKWLLSATHGHTV